jgi:CHAD domain-containing protein
MAYSIKRGDASLQDGTRRIAVSQIHAALSALDAEDLDRDAKVHEARKRCKKLRGLIRLVRPGFGGYKRENAALRDAAGRLSRLRDADVLIETYDKLVTEYGGEIDRRAFGQIRRRLTLRRDDVLKTDKTEAALQAFRGDMTAVLDRAEHWRLADNSFDAVSDGLAKTYGRARKAMRKARKTPTDRSMHEWRKRVKYHRYHAQILRRTWPGPMEAHVEAAERLGDLLGDHHDLAVFGDVLRGGSDDFGDAGVRRMAQALAHRHKKVLETRAFATGARLLAEKPEAITQRWESYWEAWHREGESEVSKPDAAA